MMAPKVETPRNGFVKQALILVFGAIILTMVGGVGSFFYWLAGQTMSLNDRAIQIDGRVTRIEEKVDSLLITRVDQAREQVQLNTRRLNDLENNQQ